MSFVTSYLNLCLCDLWRVLPLRLNSHIFCGSGSYFFTFMCDIDIARDDIDITRDDIDITRDDLYRNYYRIYRYYSR